MKMLHQYFSDKTYPINKKEFINPEILEDKTLLNI